MLKRHSFMSCIVCALIPVALFPASGRRPDQLSLEDARRVLAQPKGTETIANVPLAGFQFSREIEIGGGRRVVAISCARSGGLVAFGGDGNSIASVQTGEITSLEVFDLVEDGTSEIITDEIEGAGTGVLIRSFVVYRVTASEIRKIWKGESLSRSAPWKPVGNTHVSQKTCFLRFDPSGAGQPATMSHVCTTIGDHHFAEKIYEWRGNSLQERKGNR
jgi:hypothetical protein